MSCARQQEAVSKILLWKPNMEREEVLRVKINSKLLAEDIDLTGQDTKPSLKSGPWIAFNKQATSNQLSKFPKCNDSI